MPEEVNQPTNEELLTEYLKMTPIELLDIPVEERDEMWNVAIGIKKVQSNVISGEEATTLISGYATKYPDLYDWATLGVAKEQEEEKEIEYKTLSDADVRQLLYRRYPNAIPYLNPTQVDQLVKYTKPYLQQRYDLNFVNDMSYEDWSGSVLVGTTFDTFLNNALTTRQQAIIAAAATSTGVSNEFINAYIQDSNNNALDEMAGVDVQTLAARAYDELKSEGNSFPSEADITEKIQQYAKEYIANYVLDLRAQPDWESFIDFRAEHETIDAYVPPQAYGMPQQATIANPFVMWVMKEKAKAETRERGEVWRPDMFNPQDVYYQIERELREQGIEPPDPRDYSTQEYQARLAQYQTRVAQNAYDKARLLMEENIEERAQDILRVEIGQGLWKKGYETTEEIRTAMAERKTEWGPERAYYEANLARAREQARQEFADILPPMPGVSMMRPTGELITTTGADLAKAFAPEVARYTSVEEAQTQFQGQLEQWFPESVDYLKGYFPEAYAEFAQQTKARGTKPFGGTPGTPYTMEDVEIGEKDFMSWLSRKGRGYFETLIPPKAPRQPTRVRYL